MDPRLRGDDVLLIATTFSLPQLSTLLGPHPAQLT
jgi:hypothetical protein